MRRLMVVLSAVAATTGEAWAQATSEQVAKASAYLKGPYDTGSVAWILVSAALVF